MRDLQGGTFHRDALSLREQVVPQHNYRLNAAALEGRHYGEESCRDHRQAVLAAMPHRCAPQAAEAVPLTTPEQGCVEGPRLPVGYPTGGSASCQTHCEAVLPV